MVALNDAFRSVPPKPGHCAALPQCVIDPFTSVEISQQVEEWQRKREWLHQEAARDAFHASRKGGDAR